MRSRLYVDTGTCVFEVKLSPDDDEMVKRHIEYDQGDHGRVTEEAGASWTRRCTRRSPRASNG